MNTQEILIAARALITRPEHWTQGAYRRDTNGNKLHRDRGAVCWCPEGAISYVATDDSSRGALSAADDLLADAAGVERGMFTDWNDDPRRTHAEVLAVMDLAIERAGAE
jgi:hypothetical protein